MRLEGAMGKTLTGLALAVAPVPERGGTVAAAQGLPEPNRAAVPGPPRLRPAMWEAWPAMRGSSFRRLIFPTCPQRIRTRLLDLIPQKVGAPLEREKVRESIQALHATGRFADIQAEAERTSDGQVELTFRMRANFFVGEIFVTGAPNPPAANQIVNASKLQLGELFTREKLERGH